jgi:prophage regulatory protein
MQKTKYNNPHLHTEDRNSLNVDHLLKISEVERITSKSKSAINRDVAAGTFPAPLRIGKRAVAFKTSSITKWMDELETTVSMEG